MLEGGHEVPIRKIIDRWARSIANCATVAAELDRLYLYDNSAEGREAQLVVRAAGVRVAKQYFPARPWMEPIVAELEATRAARGLAMASLRA